MTASNVVVINRATMRRLKNTTEHPSTPNNITARKIPKSIRWDDQDPFLV